MDLDKLDNMEDLINALGQMTRLSNRIRNKYPDLISKMESDHIDNAQKVMRENSTIKESEMLRHQIVNVSAPLKGCPFNYCDKNPVCDNGCRYA